MQLPKDIPIFLNRCRADEEALFEHLSIYALTLPQANVGEVTNGSHQLNNDLWLAATDIKSLQNQTYTILKRGCDLRTPR